MLRELGHWLIWAAGMTVVLTLAGAARSDLCNLSWCVDPELEVVGDMACPEGAALDFGGNPRQLRWGTRLGCPAGAWGFGVEDPASGERVAVYDRLVDCTEVSRLCPWAPIVPEGPPAPVLISR